MRVIVLAAFFGLGAGVVLTEAQTAAQGEQVYVAQKCAVCHSIAGKGNQKGPLDDVGAKLSADEIRMWIVNATEMAEKAKATRKPPMKAYTSLPKNEVDALVAYLQTLKK